LEQKQNLDCLKKNPTTTITIVGQLVVLS